ncbi:STAS domain-containing protein [Maridesulfovibrio frigidus]|uniref:STAS domain-containing protein n=1 Tax=Maridesulfovibrio frigidus TaxID=340956 RepID=UPI00068FD4BD|nr:STAS domain-containing protein [Maridesulfovibrio frigidus]
MSDAQSSPRLGMHVLDGVLMVQTPDDFGDESFRSLRRCVLEKVHALSARGVLIDVSTIQIIDSVGYDLLADTARTVALLGAKTVFVGLQPGVVSALIDLEVDCDDILAARNVEDAFVILNPPMVKADISDEEPDEDLDEDIDGSLKDNECLNQEQEDWEGEKDSSTENKELPNDTEYDDTF